METIERTELYGMHVEAGARMVSFAGWEMPVQYAGILVEHQAVRERAGMFDVGHMGEFRVEGPEAEAFLQRILTNDLRKIRDGRAQYHMVCAEDGGVLDDVLVYRERRDAFTVVVNAGNRLTDWEWFAAQVKGFDCTLEDQSDQWGLLAVQGPEAVGMVAEAFGSELTSVQRFGFQKGEWEGRVVWFCRTGYTGEDGFEIMAPREGMPKVVERLLDLPEQPMWCGLGARDSLRIEAGFPLYGHELKRSITPLEAGLGWAVKWDKPGGFIGQEALERQKGEGWQRQVRWFRMSGKRIAREGTAVLADDQVVGEVLSGSMSAIRKCPMGSVLLERGKEKGPVWVDMRGHREQLEIVKPPLHLG